MEATKSFTRSSWRRRCSRLIQTKQVFGSAGSKALLSWKNG